MTTQKNGTNGASNGANGANGGATSKDKLPQELIDAMQALFGGKHPGYRTTHAKGLLVEGTFQPTPEAKNLSVAAHFNNPSTPVIARFSVGGGLPHIPDVDKNATPKGTAIRFQVDKNTHTDLISHTFNGFATRNGEDFLTFLKLFGGLNAAEFALKKAKAGGGDCSKEQQAFDKAQADFGVFLMTHPSVALFVGSPKPNPINYGTAKYWEPNTHVLTNKDGKVTNVRYLLDPVDGEHLYPHDEDVLKKLGRDYLEDDLRQRFPAKPIVFTLKAHIAGPNDTLDDATVPYMSQTMVPVGKLVVSKVSDDNASKQKQIAFSPNPERGGIKGITSSQDPLIQIRKGVYAISVDQRRHDAQVE